jgi:hypothetical protein
MAFGDLPAIQPGRPFASRRELFEAGVHRALQAGIVGSGAMEAELIVSSGGYTDNEDHGEVVIYTRHSSGHRRALASPTGRGSRQRSGESFIMPNQLTISTGGI